MLEDTLEERLEKGLLCDSEKMEGETKERELEESKINGGGKAGASVKKSKKDKVVGATVKASRTEANTVSVAPRVKPELTLPIMYL
ncbi:unnamed protein product [Ilex paraguariensis]|uniref:Uncharacterized protein n=1 Tax=Ilex paraguariensis TaxID=185542 RepID=A0ABC8U7K8_9AQUA